MSTGRVARHWGGICLAIVIATGCGKTEDPAPARVAPPTAASVAPAAAPTGASATAMPAKSSAFIVADEGSATFLIDAPLEKIKGKANHFRGSIEIDPAKLSATKGQVDVDLKTLKTNTFDDAGKNTQQTEHAQNWFELGNNVDAKLRDENQWARFTIKSVKSSGANSIAEIKEVDGARTVEVTAEGDLWLHGVSVPKSVKLSISFKGPQDAPKEIQVKTVDSIPVSLKAHSVMPRDIAGKFLQGTLEKIGQKIDDNAQVSLDFAAAPKKP